MVADHQGGEHQGRVAGSTAAPAARRRNCRRGSFISSSQLRSRANSREPTSIAQVQGRAGKRSGFGAYSFSKRLVPIMPTAVLDGSHPRKVERVLRHLELTHRCTTQLILCQELRLIVLHEWK